MHMGMYDQCEAGNCKQPAAAPCEMCERWFCWDHLDTVGVNMVILCNNCKKQYKQNHTS